MIPGAKTLAIELIDSGLTDNSLHEQFNVQLVRLDMVDQAVRFGLAKGFDPNALTEAELGDENAIAMLLADRAVINPATAPVNLPQLKQGAVQVRATFDAVAQGDDDADLLAIKSIARRSPFAQWKLLVRGLIGFYAEDGALATSNWDRLDTERAPGQIAQTLRRLLDSSTDDLNDESAIKKLFNLEQSVGSRPLLAHLVELRRLVRERQWQEVALCLMRLRGPLHRTDSTLAHRIAVEWEDDDQTPEGVYIPRRDTDSRLTSLMGSCLFSGEHHQVSFAVDESDDQLCVAFNNADKQAHVSVRARVSHRVSESSVFASIEEA